MTLGGGEGETGILGKHDNQGILQMGDRILMKLDIQKNFMSQMFNFQFELDLGTQRVRGGKPEILETGNLGKGLEQRDWDET